MRKLRKERRNERKGVRKGEHMKEGRGVRKDEKNQGKGWEGTERKRGEKCTKMSRK